TGGATLFFSSSTGGALPPSRAGVGFVADCSFSETDGGDGETGGSRSSWESPLPDWACRSLTISCLSSNCLNLASDTCTTSCACAATGIHNGPSNTPTQIPRSLAFIWLLFMLHFLAVERDRAMPGANAGTSGPPPPAARAGIVILAAAVDRNGDSQATPNRVLT